MIATRFIVLLAFIASAFGFTRPSGVRSSVVTQAAKSEALPFLPQPPNIVDFPGQVGFDPFGFSNNIDAKWLLEAEIKHGRIAMLATLGFIFADITHLPGDVHAVSSAQAHDVFVQNGAFSQVNWLISILELVSVKAINEMYEGSGRQPGEFGFDPLNLSKGKSDAVKLEYAKKELANGRLAMLAFSGIVTQAVLTGKGFPYY